MCFIGVSHEYGQFGNPIDSEEAYSNYLLSAQLNNDLGTYKLAQCYENGKGTSRNIEKALYFYRCAAKLGLPDALHSYGSILVNGCLGSEVDEKTGLDYLSLESIHIHYLTLENGTKTRQEERNSMQMKHIHMMFTIKVPCYKILIVNIELQNV